MIEEDVGPPAALAVARAAVAASVGYNSADVFTRAFQRRFGITPAEYRARFSAHDAS